MLPGVLAPARVHPAAIRVAAGPRRDGQKALQIDLRERNDMLRHDYCRTDRWPRCPQPPSPRSRKPRARSKSRSPRPRSAPSSTADYADIDADKDGKATPAEIDARLVKSAEAELELIKKERDAAFAKLDTDGDGTISRAEFDAKAPSCRRSSSPTPSRSSTGSTPTRTARSRKEEFRGPTLANFAMMDANKDGTVTPAEANAVPPPLLQPSRQRSRPSRTRRPSPARRLPLAGLEPTHPRGSR